MTERDLFIAALKITDLVKRSAWLDLECGGDATLRQRMDVLLLAFDDAGSLLENPPVGPEATSAEQGQVEAASGNGSEPTAEAPGTVIGPYKLLQRIGEGGMGTVFMAEQTQPVRRKVALKVIKQGMDTRQVIARFEAERQALAMMDHLNIARVLDVGATDTGRPYFVMELVHGVPITKYCDDNHLTPRERLELFVPVCQAIQHAHQKGIIHRDIKPSNVMITLYDGKPVPKVIDFGVAKATEQKLTERTMFTQYGTIVGTLEYMSPEQAEMSGLGVDTRGDIYSLGVLLYELLTGSTPLERPRMREAAYAEVLRLIREEEAPKPSARLSSSDTLPAIAAARKTEPAKLARLVRGELDWIVLKALEKDRTRRYETASGFAADVQRYLSDETVQACPASTWYRSRKFARRNRAALTMSSVVALAVLLAVGSIGWMVRDRAAREDEATRERAAQSLLVEESVKRALDLSDEYLQKGKWQLSLVEANRADSILASGPTPEDLRQRVAERLADLQMVMRLEAIRTTDAENPALHDSDVADKTYTRMFQEYGIDVEGLDAVEAGRVIGHRAVRLELAQALESWARVHMKQAKSDPSKWKRLLAMARAADPDEWRGRVRDALERRDTKRLLELAKGPEATEQPAATVDLLASALRLVNEQESAVALLRRALNHYRDHFRINHQLGVMLMETKPPQPDEAVRYDQAALALSPRSPGIVYNLGVALTAKGQLAEAVELLREAAANHPSWAPAHGGLGNALVALGIALGDKRLLDEAIADYSKAIELDPKLAGAWNNRGNAYGHLGQFDKAVADYSKAIELDSKLADAWTNRGVVFHQLGQFDKAIAGFTKAIELDPKRASAWSNRGWAYSELHQYKKAIADCSKAIELDSKMAKAWFNRGKTYNDLHQYERAIADCSKAIDLDPKLADAWNNRGVAFMNLGDLDKSVADYSKAIELDSNFAGAWINRGNAYSSLLHYEKAIADFSKAIELEPKSAAAWCDRGNVYFRLGQEDKALAGYAKAIELDPKDGLPWYNRGNLYMTLHQSDKALSNHSRALELDPKYAPAWYARGVTHLKLGQQDKAVTDYSKAVELDPQNATWHNDLAWLLATCPNPKLRDPSRAVELAKRAVELAPKEGNFRNTLGVAYFRAGNWQEAVSALESSAKLRLGGDSFDWLFLAMAHRKLDHKEEARKWYDQAVEWMEKSKEEFEKDAEHREELQRFRAEAKEVLGLNDSSGSKK